MLEILLASSRKDRRASALAIDERGVMLGPVRLIRAARKQIGSRRFEPCPPVEVAETLAVAFSDNVLFDLEARLHQLRIAAQALSDGAITRAHIALAFLRLPALINEARDRLEKLAAIRKYNPNVAEEARVPAGETGGGRWSDDGGGDAGGQAQLASNDTVVMSDATKPTPPADQDKNHVVLNDGTIVKDSFGNPMMKPPDVSLEANALKGQEMLRLYNAMVQTNGGDAAEQWRDATMLGLFSRRWGSMDYQWLYSPDGKSYNRDYIDLGNYNYGVVAAAAGYSWSYATTASGIANLFGGGDKTGPMFNNRRNLKMIRQGYDDYNSGKIAPLGK